MQLFEFGKMIYFILTMGKIVQTTKNFRHIVSISTYIVGLTLNAFSYAVMDKIEFSLGVCYWLCVSVLSLFILIIIYGKISIGKMVK